MAEHRRDANDISCPEHSCAINQRQKPESRAVATFKSFHSAIPLFLTGREKGEPSSSRRPEGRLVSDTSSYCLCLSLDDFFVSKAVFSSWSPRIPEVKRTLGLSSGELGIALFGIAAGSVPALLLTMRLLDHLRSGPVCVVTAVIFGAARPLISKAGKLWQLTGPCAGLPAQG